MPCSFLSRLVDDALDLQPRDAAGVLGRLPLRVVEVGRNRDHGLGDFLAEIVLGGFFHLAKNLRRDFGRRDLLAADLDPGVVILSLDDLVGHQVDILVHFLFVETPADEAFHGVERVPRVGDRLPLGRRADEDFPVLHVSDDGGRGACALGVLDHLGLAALHDRDAGVGRAEVDSDDLSHGLSF